MAENKKSFLLYSDHKELFETLSDKDAAELIRHIFRYVNDENPISNNPIVNISFITIKLQLKRDLVKYEDTKTSKAKAGALGNLKRWNPDLYKKVSSSEMTIDEAISIAEHRRTSQSVANIAVIDNDNDNVIDIKNNSSNLAETSSANPKSVKADLPKEEKAFTDNPVKAEKEKKEPSVYTECMDIYCRFIKFNNGIPVINKLTGKSLKEIIAHLRTASIDKGEGQDKEVVETFYGILKAYKRWQPFHQGQTKLNQINSNLQDIILAVNNQNPIKNGKSTSLYQQSVTNPFQ